MRAKDRKTVTTALAMNSELSMLCNIIQSEAFSNLGLLLRVTALVLKFIKLLKGQRQGDVNQKPEIHVTGADIEEAELLWIKKIQREMKSKEKFTIRSLCDYRRRNEEWMPSIYLRLHNLIVKGNYMSKA